MIELIGATKKEKLPKPGYALVLVVLGGALANALLSALNMALSSPFFFDSIFTAMAAALFGPLAGVTCAIFTHLFMELLHGFSGAFLPFVVCNMATGLIVGLFARAGRFAIPVYALVATLLVTLANSVLGAIVATFLFGGITGHASDFLVTGFLLAGQSLASAAFWARIPSNLIDKGIAIGFAAVAVQVAAKRGIGASNGKKTHS